MNALNLPILVAAVVSCAATACSRETPQKTAVTDSALAQPIQPIAPSAGTGATAVNAPAGTVGFTYSALPAGYRYLDGAVMRGGYDLAHVATPKGERIWLDSAAGPSKVVRAELTVPPLAKDERLFMASCDANGKLDPNVVAIVVTEAGVTRFSKVRQAWRVNTAAGRFDLIPVAGITCDET